MALASSTPPQLIAPFRVFKVEPQDGGGYIVHARRGETVEHTGGKYRVPLPAAVNASDALATLPLLTLRTPQPPLLCAGFEGSVRLGVVKDLFTWGQVDAEEESAGAEENEDGQKIHPDVSCDGSGQCPLVGTRYHKIGADHDLNEAEFKKLAPADQQAYEAIAYPGATPVPVSGAVESDFAGEESSAVVKESDAAVKGSEATGKETSGGCADSSPLLNEFDESTKTPGLFLAGPAVRHEGMSFCFVYKFRQRFAIVADAIARGLGFLTTKAVKDCREMNMFLDDFSCCKAACGETC